MANDAYRESGVDIEAGERVVTGIREHVHSTRRPEVLTDIGGFGGLFALGNRFRDPVLVSGTDGVGTKLLVANRVGVHDSIGIDLVAMCVNDIVTLGAEPLFFLDYFATGKLAPELAVSVVKGIAEGCRQSGCALIGGETAEMPGMYGPGHYDLAGFCVGVVERDGVIDGQNIAAGDAVVGIPSSGIHSNGFSLVRKLCDELDWSESHGLGAPLGEVLLTPTRIYVDEVRKLMEAGEVKGLVHVTGGGIVENLPRVLPGHLGAVLKRNRWSPPPVFDLLQRLGGLSDHEMVRTFNAGLGMLVVVPAECAEQTASLVGGMVVGEIVEDVEQRALVV